MGSIKIRFCRADRKYWLAVFACFLVVAGILQAQPVQSAQDAVYRFGVFPYLPPSRLEESYAPVAAAFSQVLSHPVRLVTANGFGQFRHRLEREEFDIALIQPMDIVPIVDQGPYLPLANRPSHGANLVVLENSHISQLSDLYGKTIGLPPANVPVSVILEISLAEQGLGKSVGTRVRHFSNILACLHQLLIGSVDACGSGGGASLDVFEKKMGVKLQVLLRTPPFPHMLFVVHPRLVAEERQRLKQVILHWEKTREGRRLLQRLSPDAHFVPYHADNYDVIRNYWQYWKDKPHVLH